jgi:hypothetical protein
MKLPALIIAEQRNFHLEPIPGTHGAKAFSTVAATSLLAERLPSHSQITVHNDLPHLIFSFNHEEFEVSLNLFCYRNGSDHYSQDLVIFPCVGLDIPWHLRERLTVSIAPVLAPHYKDTVDVISRASRLSAASSIVTAGLEELFGLRSGTRVRSISPISPEDMETLNKHQARLTR